MGFESGIASPESAPERRKKILPEDLTLPDMSPIVREKDGYDRIGTVEFPLDFEGRDLKVRLTCERFGDPKEPSDAAQIARISLETFQPGEEDAGGRTSAFKAALSTDRNRYEREYATRDGLPHLSWHIYYRNIHDQTMRGKGFGEWNLRAVEEAARRVGAAQPMLDAEWIQLDTSLGSLSNLVVDPDWLERRLKEGAASDPVLQARASRKGRNLGYVPHPRDEAQALRLLKERWSDLDDIPQGKHQNVRFVKPLKPFDPKTMFVGPERRR